LKIKKQKIKIKRLWHILKEDSQRLVHSKEERMTRQ